MRFQTYDESQRRACLARNCSGCPFCNQEFRSLYRMTTEEESAWLIHRQNQHPMMRGLSACRERKARAMRTHVSPHPHDCKCGEKTPPATTEQAPPVRSMTEQLAKPKPSTLAEYMGRRAPISEE
jgi:hypothetical protein